MTKKKFCLSLLYNGANSYLFVNGTEINKFKANNSGIVATPLCLGNISKDWSVDNMKRIGFDGYFYDFSVDYDAIAVDDILDIYKYLMKKKQYDIKVLEFTKKVRFVELTILSTLTTVNSLICISMNNQECKVRPEIVDINSDGPVFYPFSIKTSKCSGSCSMEMSVYVLTQFVIALTISIDICACFAYKYMNHWYLKKDAIHVKFGNRTQTTI